MTTSREIGARLDAAHRHQWLERMQFPNRGRIRAALLIVVLFIVAAMPVRDALKYEEAQRAALAQMNKRILALHPDPPVTPYAQELKQ